MKKRTFIFFLLLCLFFYSAEAGSAKLILDGRRSVRIQLLQDVYEIQLRAQDNNNNNNNTNNNKNNTNNNKNNIPNNTGLALSFFTNTNYYLGDFLFTLPTQALTQKQTLAVKKESIENGERITASLGNETKVVSINYTSPILILEKREGSNLELGEWNTPNIPDNVEEGGRGGGEEEEDGEVTKKAWILIWMERNAVKISVIGVGVVALIALLYAVFICVKRLMTRKRKMIRARRAKNEVRKRTISKVTKRVKKTDTALKKELGMGSYIGHLGEGSNICEPTYAEEQEDNNEVVYDDVLLTINTSENDTASFRRLENEMVGGGDGDDDDYDYIEVVNENVAGTSYAKFENANSAKPKPPFPTATNIKSANVKSVKSNLSATTTNVKSTKPKSSYLTANNVKSANLESAKPKYANFESAKPKYANLESAKPKYANLESAKPKSANLGTAKLESALLTGAGFKSALQESALSKASFATAKNVSKQADQLAENADMNARFGRKLNYVNDNDGYDNINDVEHIYDEVE